MTDKLLNTLAVTEQVKSEVAKVRHVRIAVPFITKPGVELLTERMQLHPKSNFHVQLLTRFDIESVLAGVCDLEALQRLLELKTSTIHIEIKRANNLHAKYFVFDERSILIGSSNMTLAAQSNNIEMGFFTTDRVSVQSALSEFDGCWQSALAVDDNWIIEQKKLIEPFLKRYQKMRSELRGLMVLQSIRMPGTEEDFLASLKQILKKADTAKGVSKAWIEQEMLRTSKEDLAEDEPSINIDKRIIFLKILGLVDDKEGPMLLTDTGRECRADNKKLLERMVATFPILSNSYNAVPSSGFCTFKDIAHVDPDPRKITDPSQTLRNAIHWLSAFGLVDKKRVGNAYHFKRKKSALTGLVFPL